MHDRPVRSASARRRRGLAALAAVAALFTVPLAAHAQAWPSKPVRLVVGFAPGGVADVTARALAQKLGESLGVAVVVENRPSAGGIVAAEAVAKAEPDGHTLLLLTNGNAVSASLFKTLPFDLAADFAPVSLVGTFDVALVASAESRIDSLAALLAWAKSHPGKLNIGTINVGSTQHLAAELFRSMTGVDGTVVPYKGSPAVITALRANDVQVAFEMLAPVLPQAKAGAVRVLAVGGERRSDALPGAPTIAEAGVPGYAASSWNAVAAPRGTPPAVIDRLAREIAKALAAPDLRERLAAAGVTARASTPDELRKLVAADTAKWRAVIEKAGIERQ